MDTQQSQPILRPSLVGSTQRYDGLKRLAILLYVALLGFIFIKGSGFYLILGAALITSLAFVPLFLWLRLEVKGIPVFPVFAGSFVWCYALPLVLNHPKLVQYQQVEQFKAALAISLFLLIGTLSWIAVMRLPFAFPARCLCLPPFRNKNIWIIILLGAVLFNAATLAGWLPIPYGLYVIVRAAAYTLTIISLFTLGYLSGRGDLSQLGSFSFIALLVANCLIRAMSLLLVGAMTDALIAAVGRTLGSRRPSILIGLVLLASILVLHFGKSEMRAKYWGGRSGISYNVQPQQIPRRLIEWYGYSLKTLTTGKALIDRHEKDRDLHRPSLLLRPSLMHMFMLPFSNGGGAVPYLYGRTYSSIPFLLIPRIIYPNKPISHAGTNLLTVTFGLQSRAQVSTTTIAWGLVDEAWANFGLYGLIVAAFLMGIVLAVSTRFSMGTPLSSLRSMLTLLLLPPLLIGGTTLAVFITSYFQASIVVVGLSYVAMRPFNLLSKSM